MSINGNANANGGNGLGSLWDTLSKSLGDLISGATDYVYEKNLGHPRGWDPNDDRPYYVPAPNTPQNPSGGPPADYKGMVFSNIPVIYAAGAAVIILVVLLARRK